MSNAENNHETTRPGGITGNGFKPGQTATPEDAPKDSQKQSATYAAGRPYVLPMSCWRSPRIRKPVIAIEWPRCRELLDRGWGKAPAFAAIEAEDPLELSDIAREIQGIADELAARREAKNSNGTAIDELERLERADRENTSGF